MREKRDLGLGFYIQSGKKTAYPTAGRPGRSTGGNREHSLSVGRPLRSTGYGQKNFSVFQAWSVDRVGRPGLWQARSVDRAGRPVMLKTEGKQFLNFGFLI